MVELMSLHLSTYLRYFKDVLSKRVIFDGAPTRVIKASRIAKIVPRKISRRFDHCISRSAYSRSQRELACQIRSLRKHHCRVQPHANTLLERTPKAGAAP